MIALLMVLEVGKTEVQLWSVWLLRLRVLLVCGDVSTDTNDTYGLPCFIGDNLSIGSCPEYTAISSDNTHFYLVVGSLLKSMFDLVVNSSTIVGVNPF